MIKPSSACSLALSGKSPFSFGFYISKKCSVNYWIVDSGTTDHMTYSSQCFSTYTPCPNNRKIIVANGSLATVAGLGDIQVTPFIILKDLHHVPMLLVNLISIQKIIKKKNELSHCFLPPLIVFFKIRFRGGRLDLLRKMTNFTTLRHQSIQRKS